jgi:hypothetical protein
MTEQVPERELAKPPTEATADVSHGERDFPKEDKEGAE